MSEKIYRTILVVLILFPIGLFYVVVDHMAFNAPYQDDFDALLEPTLEIRRGEGNTFSDFWNIIYRQDDERRHVINRLTSVVIDKTTGSLNFRYQTIIGALTLLVLAGMLAHYFYKGGTPLIYFVPVLYLIFNIQYFDAVFDALNPLQHVAVFVWSFTSLWLICLRTRLGLVLSIVLGILAIFSDVSGNFLLVPAVALLVVQKRWTALLFWVVFVGGVSFYYFYNLEVPGYRPSLTDNLSKPGSLISIALALPGMWLEPGMRFPFGVRAAVSIGAGIVTLLFLVWKVVPLAQRAIKNEKSLTNQEFFLLAALLFMGTIFGALTLGRAAYGLESNFKTRYQHMYIFWLVLLYLLYLVSFPKHRQSTKSLVICLFLSFLFFAKAYVQNWNELDYFRKTVLTDNYEWKNNRIIPSTPIYQTPEIGKMVDDIYEGAYETGVYKGPDAQWLDQLADAKVNGKAKADIMDDGGYFIVVSAPELERSFGKNDGIYVILRSADKTHIFPTKNKNRPLHRILLSGKYYYPGITSDNILKSYLNSSSFDLEFGVVDGKKMYRLETGLKVAI